MAVGCAKTTVRGKMDVEPALSAPKACQKSSGAVLIVVGTTHTHTTLGDGLDGCGIHKAPQ